MVSRRLGLFLFIIFFTTMGFNFSHLDESHAHRRGQTIVTGSGCAICQGLLVLANGHGVVPVTLHYFADTFQYLSVIRAQDFSLGYRFRPDSRGPPERA